MPSKSISGGGKKIQGKRPTTSIKPTHRSPMKKAASTVNAPKPSVSLPVKNQNRTPNVPKPVIQNPMSAQSKPPVNAPASAGQVVNHEQQQPNRNAVKTQAPVGRAPQSWAQVPAATGQPGSPDLKQAVQTNPVVNKQP
jgi:hypothetical protein